jgi:hypothetical protein
MTLTVENGTGVTGANSYVSVADYIAYALLYGKVIASGPAEIELRKAWDYMQGLKYKGTKTFPTTTNDAMFPRDNIYIADHDHCIATGTPITAAQSLTMAIRVQEEVALGIDAGIDNLAIKGGKVVSSETFGLLARAFATNKESPLTNPRVDLFLNPLLRNEIMPLHFRVVSDKESSYLCKHRECNRGYCMYLGDGYSYYE